MSEILKTILSNNINSPLQAIKLHCRVRIDIITSKIAVFKISHHAFLFPLLNFACRCGLLMFKFLKAAYKIIVNSYFYIFCIKFLMNIEKRCCIVEFEFSLSFFLYLCKFFSYILSNFCTI